MNQNAKPLVLLIARPTFDKEAIDRFLSSQQTLWRRDAKATESEELIEFSGRICYMSFGDNQSPKTNAEYLRNLVDQGHESVLEHAVWTFVLTGVTRSFTHQLVRHRVGFSFSQLSQQYVDHSKPAIVPPIELAAYPDVAEAWTKAVADLTDAYRRILRAVDDSTSSKTFSSLKERKRFLRSAARTILPNATETKIVFSANARALRHFLRVRGNIEGDPEMRAVSAQLLRVLKTEAPTIFEDFEIDQLSDGSPIVRTRVASKTPA